MTTQVPDLDALSRGELRLLAEDHPAYRATLDSFLRWDIELASEATWRRWLQFRQVELWQAVALQLHMDPDKGLVGRMRLLQLEQDRLAPQYLFHDRMQKALLHVKHGSLSIVEAGEHPTRAMVRLWDFAAWCDEIGLPCPAEMPRRDPKVQKAPAVKRQARQAPDIPSEFLRESDLLAGLVPFSPSTLWRYVKAGKFPAPVKLPGRITAWRRADYEKWKEEQSSAPPARGKGKRA